MCYQLVHPSAQTPCFIEAGSRPCSEENCPVYDASSTSTLARTLGSRAFREYIENNLLHNVCRMSKFTVDNLEYRQRISKGG